LGNWQFYNLREQKYLSILVDIDVFKEKPRSQSTKTLIYKENGSGDTQFK